MEILQQVINGNVTMEKDSDNFITNCMLLRQNMPGEKKKILLRMIDEKNLMIEEAAYHNFEKGFCAGVRLAAEIFLRQI